MQFSPKQNEFIRNANQRYNFKIGAVRSGKSYVDIAYTVPYRLRAVKDKDGLNFIIGVSKETIERNVLQPMREIYTDAIVGTINSRNIAMVCGVPVYCIGAEKISQLAKIQGASIKYCYGDEVADWSEDVFNLLKSRLDKSYSCFDGTFNPQGPNHWLHEFLESDADIFYQTYGIDDNPFLPPEFVTNLKAEYAGTVLYDRYILGLWAAAEGALFTTYPKYTDDVTFFRDGIAHIDAAYGGEDFTAFTCGKRQGDTLYLYGKIWHKHVDTVLNLCVSEAKRLLCAPILSETNADKGYLAKEIMRRDYSAMTYHENMNKHLKIATFLKKWWPNVVFLGGTDKQYVGQILSYTEDAPHDDAPDSAANVARYYDKRGGIEYKSVLGL